MGWRAVSIGGLGMQPGALETRGVATPLPRAGEGGTRREAVGR